jgi:hypothetical protein
MSEIDLPNPPKELPAPEEELTSGETEPVEKEKTHRGKGLLASFVFGFLFIVLVVLVGGGSFVLGHRMKSDNKQQVTTIVHPPSPTPNTTIGWKTYTNKDFSVQYPENFTAQTMFNVNAQFFSGDIRNIKTETLVDISNPNGFYLDYPGKNLVVDKKTTGTISGIAGKRYEGRMNDHSGISRKFIAVIVMSKNNPSLYWQLVLFGKTDKISSREAAIFDKMASTLKFTKPSNPTPTISAPQVACTQETKLCPDGVTYVGRTGPICEFAVCPK